jgi:hypothetical protein
LKQEPAAKGSNPSRDAASLAAAVVADPYMVT